MPLLLAAPPVGDWPGVAQSDWGIHEPLSLAVPPVGNWPDVGPPEPVRSARPGSWRFPGDISATRFRQSGHCFKCSSTFAAGTPVSLPRLYILRV